MHGFVVHRKVDEATIEKYTNKLPAELISLWKEYGFGAFLNGYLKLIDPDEYAKLLKASYFAGEVSIPFLATAFGEVITWERDAYVGIVQYPRCNFDIILKNFRFFFQVLTDPGVQDRCFYLDAYEKAVARYGELSYDKCFGYVPLLPLGGKDSVDNLKKLS